MKVWYYFELAKKAAQFDRDCFRLFYLGAVGIRSDGVLVSARNGAVINPNRAAHAEYRIGKKMDVGSTIFVARIKPINNGFGMARPCFNCRKFLISRGIDRVYYTISDDEYGCLQLNSSRSSMEDIL